MPKTIFLLVLFLGAAGQMLAQPATSITIQEESIRVGKLLREISRQSGADFSYNSKVVDTKAKVSFQIQNATLEETLELLTQTIDVSYILIEGQIVLKYAEAAPEEPEEQQFILSGFLSDKTTGENLIGASVSVKGSGLGTITNEFGFYSLSLKKGNYQIVFSYVGFQQVELAVNLIKNVKKLISLPPATIDLPAIVVDRPLREIQLESSSLDKMTIAPERLSELPEFGGESGLVKGLQSLPGIQTHSDGSAFFYVRGGERDQNLIIIDDAPIYNPSHLLGFYSMVIPDFTKKMTVYKNDQPASMGDRLSSIISIRTKDGNLNKVEFSGALNPLVNRLSLSTPMFKKRSSLFLSSRSSNFEWLYRSVNNEATIRFWDFHLKWNLKINDKNRLFLTSIRGGDVLSNGGGPVNGIRWGNTAATLRWNHIFGPKLFSNTTLYSGNYAYNLVFQPSFWKSELGTVSFKTDFTHYTTPNFTSKFGIELQSYFTTPGRLGIDSTIAVIPDIRSDESRKAVLYYQGKYDLTERLQLNLGLRLINWENRGPKIYYQFDENYAPVDTIRAPGGVYNEYTNLAPRLSLRYQLDSTSQLKLSVGRYHQYLQLIQNSISPFTALEVWLPASPNIRPQAATQIAFDYQRLFPKLNATFSASAYYKIAENQIDYEAHATTYLNPFLESELRFGQSRAYGMEFFFKKDFGKLNGWAKYGYARVFRQTDGLNNNELYPAFQDRPHDFSLALNYDLSERIRYTLFWISHSGSTFTSPVGFYTFNNQTIPLYGDRNNDRLPAYHRMDVAIRFQLNKKETARYQHSLTFSIYNVLLHQNVYSVKFNKRLRPNLGPPVPVNLFSDDPLSPSQIDLIRFFPSLTYKFEL
jgi:hypothetical protein